MYHTNGTRTQRVNIVHWLAWGLGRVAFVVDLNLGYSSLEYGIRRESEF